MSYHPRPSSLYASTTSSATHTSQSSALQTRITQKRAELENLRQLRDLSAQLATQMGTLEQKLATLRDGTQAVGEVLKNWTGVLGVLGMAGKEMERVLEQREGGTQEHETDLPGTLVRIPVGVEVVGVEKGEDEEEGKGKCAG